MRSSRKNKNRERRPVATSGSSCDVAAQVAAFKALIEAAGYEVVVVTREQWEARDE
jgi:putative protein kinase ArgK-like GTPase of G3E family